MAYNQIAVIPSRLESRRLPNKPLANILGIPMILHVYERAKLCNDLDEVFVATDSLQIKSIVEEVGGKVLLTDKDHICGTDRIAQAVRNIDTDIVVNIQGDEALLNPNYISLALKPLIENKSLDVAMLVNKFQKKNSISDIKVVLDVHGNIIYLSRADIPFSSNNSDFPFYKAYHVIPFRKDFLLKFAALERSRLEILESNEYLRIIEHGYTIFAVEVESTAISVDTIDDLAYVRSAMPTDKYFHAYSKNFL